MKAGATIVMVQAATDEDFELAFQLHREYFHWVAEQFKETMSLDVKTDVEGAASRFLPVKDFDELAKRRADIEVVAHARGMV